MVLQVSVCVCTKSGREGRGVRRRRKEGTRLAKAEGEEGVNTVYIPFIRKCCCFTGVKGRYSPKLHASRGEPEDEASSSTANHIIKQRGI